MAAMTDVRSSRSLTGNIISMKIRGWLLFIILWYLKSESIVYDINYINHELQNNIQSINKALIDTLPMSIGNCTTVTWVGRACLGMS